MVECPLWDWLVFTHCLPIYSRGLARVSMVVGLLNHVYRGSLWHNFAMVQLYLYWPGYRDTEDRINTVKRDNMKFVLFLLKLFCRPGVAGDLQVNFYVVNRCACSLSAERLRGCDEWVTCPGSLYHHPIAWFMRFSCGNTEKAVNKASYRDANTIARREPPKKT